MTLVAHWPLQEDSGDANDASGNGNTGTVNGATQGATGLLGATAYSLDGSNDYVNLGNYRDLSAGAFTISLWTNFPSVSNYRVIHGTNTNTPKFAVDTPGTSPGKLRILLNDGTNSMTATTTNSYDDGVWHFVTATWDGSSTAKIYVDGEERASSSNSSMGTFDGGKTKAIGRDGDGDSFYWNGSITAVRDYDHRLTPAEIQYLYDRVTMPTYSTGVKTYGSTITPDLEVPTFTLNGESCEITVVGSPGTASEEKQSASLTGGTTSYTLSWGSSHTDFRLDVTAGPLSNVENRVSISEANLVI